MDTTQPHPIANHDAARALRSLTSDQGGDASPSEDKPTAPTPEEMMSELIHDVHLIKESILGGKQKRESAFNVPEIPITNEDRERFEDCLDKRRPFSETYPMLNGKLSVTFRTKTKKETDLLFDQIDQDFASGRIKSEVKYSTLLNNYNLILQMVEFKGVKLIPVVPASGVLPEGWSLNGCLSSHVIDTLSEEAIVLLLSALSQFDSRVVRLRQEAVDKNFPQPAGVS